MEAVVLGAALGVAFQQLHDTIIRAIAGTSGPKLQLQLLAEKVQILNRKLSEMKELLLQLGEKFPAEILKLQQLLEKAKNLVSDCSQVSIWNYYRKRKYKRRLSELDASLLEILRVDFPAAELKYTLQVLVKVIEMNNKLDRMYKKGSDHGAVANPMRENSTTENSMPGKNKGHSPRFQVHYEKKVEKVFKVHFL